MNIATTSPSIHEQTGWKRPGPHTLCQDFDLRIRIAETDFDLEDLDFQQYAKVRGILYLAGAGIRWKIVADHSVTQDDFLTADRWEPLRWWIDAKTGEQTRPQTAEELNISWLIIRAAKGALQDCWEIYRAQPALLL